MKRILKYFTSTGFFVSIVPPDVPLPLVMVYVTGVLELIGAVAIWIPAWRSWRLVAQVVLLAIIWWSTRPDEMAHAPLTS